MKTLALVIGNNDYPGRGKLENAVNDANAIFNVFSRLGYEVLYKENCVVTDYDELLEQFENGMASVDASIFYFAGHGFEFQGENYLTSIESPLENPTVRLCERTCIRLSEITDIIKRSSTKVNIIIIDACRGSFDRGVSSTFASVTAPEGTIIAFSTSPGEGAKDSGFDGHSLYTGALLQYLGREFLSVEELFKKTRKTVHNLSSGTQTSWEHTSLVGDFYFNTGQLVHSVTIPYEESVVKDRLFSPDQSDIEQIILKLKSCDWNEQNPAMVKLRGTQVQNMTENQKFLLGRNILQSSSHAFESQSFMKDLASNLRAYNSGGKNDVLNGILFEMYFDNNGDFRQGKFKKHHLDEVFSLRKLPEYEASFNFIKEALSEYRESLFYIPEKDDHTIDVDVLANAHLASESNEAYETIESIIVDGKDITEGIKNMRGFRTSSEALKQIITEYLTAPESLVNINSNVAIQKFKFHYDGLDF
ncbi:caspase family protein [Aliivibrio fischeri]|uniref:Caspase family protein n=1 Tax=Aliivibrio fischeri TaxID=668 RepID=A0A844P7M2_ALIFS|nr:caspase family protein [Aliivibrio fischeri]MUK51489.1 caspase family protein [Aliivibrio fischeri]